MATIRVLRVISHLDVGGVQRQMLLAFRGMRDQGIEPECCVIHYRGRMAEQFEAEGFPVHLIKFRSRIDPLGVLRLRMLVHRRRIDIVHSHMYNANIGVNAAMFARGGVKLVNGYHNQILVKSDRQAHRVKASANRPDAFVAVGESVKASLMELSVPGDRITVIHNGVVGPETVTPLPRREPGEPLRLVWAGRYVNQKRVEFFADIAAACRAAGVPVHLTILGDGPGFGKVKRAIEAAGVQDCVEQAGVTTDVFGWLAKSDVFVSASYREGFPNALLEACAAGRPFVVSDIEPHRELLGASTAGVLVPQDAAKWAEVLGELERDRARLERMASESLAIGRAFSIEAACEKTVALYRRLMS